MRRVAVVLAAVLACAGCGGAGPPIAPRTADPLAKEADAVAARLGAGDACGARDRAAALQRRTIAAINAGRIPAELRGPLQARVNELVAELEPECLPSVAPESPPAVSRPTFEPPGKGEKRGRGHGKPKKHKPGKHDRGKHKGHDD